jgi:hypothetical protein
MKIITDFTTEYHPQPKPLARVKLPKAMKKEGKKTISWSEERKKLVQKFTEMGITKCEINFKDCWRNTALGFAHLAKRRKLGPDDLQEVVLSCNPCHGIVEVWPPDQMMNFLQAIIDGRKTRK